MFPLCPFASLLLSLLKAVMASSAPLASGDSILLGTLDSEDSAQQVESSDGSDSEIQVFSTGQRSGQPTRVNSSTRSTDRYHIVSGSVPGQQVSAGPPTRNTISNRTPRVSCCKQNFQILHDSYTTHRIPRLPTLLTAHNLVHRSGFVPRIKSIPLLCSHDQLFTLQLR